MFFIADSRSYTMSCALDDLEVMLMSLSNTNHSQDGQDNAESIPIGHHGKNHSHFMSFLIGEPA
jgi:hypothetical protein